MKKSQIKLFESIAVLIIFVFLVAIGIQFYGNVQMRALNDAATEFSELSAIKSTLVLSNLPELACSFQGINDVGCVDIQKIKAWERLTNTTLSGYSFLEHYIPILGLSEVIIEEIYPSSKRWVIYNASVGNFSVRILGETRLEVPTVIFDPETNKNSFGIIRVKTYMVR